MEKRETIQKVSQKSNTVVTVKRPASDDTEQAQSDLELPDAKQEEDTADALTKLDPIEKVPSKGGLSR